MQGNANSFQLVFSVVSSFSAQVKGREAATSCPQKQPACFRLHMRLGKKQATSLTAHQSDELSRGRTVGPRAQEGAGQTSLLTTTHSPFSRLKLYNCCNIKQNHLPTCAGGPGSPGHEPRELAIDFAKAMKDQVLSQHI